MDLNILGGVTLARIYIRSKIGVVPRLIPTHLPELRPIPVLSASSHLPLPTERDRQRDNSVCVCVFTSVYSYNYTYILLLLLPFHACQYVILIVY